MKTNPAGSPLETCQTAGQGEKGCPVCQACGGTSGQGSASGTGSGLRPGPGVVLDSGLGPGAIPGPGPGPSAIPGSRPQPSAVSVTGLRPGTTSGPTTTLGPGLGAGSLPGPGTRPGLRPGSESVPAPVLQPGAGPVPQPGAGPVSQAGVGSVPQPGVGSVPQPVSESVTSPGSAPLPGLGLGPGTRRGSGTGSDPGESVRTPVPALQQKTQAKHTQAPRQKVLVTGGGGYLGFSLGSSLAKRGTSVILLDLRRPQWPLPSGTEFIQVQRWGSWWVGAAGGAGAQRQSCEPAVEFEIQALEPNLPPILFIFRFCYRCMWVCEDCDVSV